MCDQHMESRRWLKKVLPARLATLPLMQSYLEASPSAELANGVLHVLAMLSG
jgi:hypothetical protein